MSIDPVQNDHQIKQIEKPKDIPRHEIPLPSLGKVYPTGYPLANKDHALIRAMTTKDEDILSSEPLIKSGNAIDEYVMSALGDKIEVGPMLIGDKEAIMHAFRATGYGAEYDVEVKCKDEDCGAKFNHTFDLGKLQVKTLDIDPVEPNCNLFEMPDVLPISKQKVFFSLMTVENDKEITQTIDTMKKKMKKKRLPVVSLRLLYHIQRINDITDRGKIRDIIEDMSPRDSVFLRKYIKKVSPGLITAQQVECPHCGNVEELQIPLDISFFFPGEQE